MVPRCGKRSGEPALNESPSEKEGKSDVEVENAAEEEPSMKVPPKRKGNGGIMRRLSKLHAPSMKVPPKRKGNAHSVRASDDY